MDSSHQHPRGHLQIQLGKFSKAEDTLIGIIELVSLGLYVVPQTSVFGAILMTGHIGGAIATHVWGDSPIFTHTLFSIYVAVILWGGLYQREPRLAELMPSRR
jgi:DoxX-like family